MAVLLLVVIAAAAAAVFGGLLDQPFWFDEQSRAYQIALPGLHMGAASGYAPLSLGWVLVEKAAIAVLPRTEFVLRLPELVALLLLGPACYVLARKLMPTGIAFLLAAALVANPATVYYGTQLKAYIVEALATVVILLLWGTRAGGDGDARSAGVVCGDRGRRPVQYPRALRGWPAVRHRSY